MADEAKDDKADKTKEGDEKEGNKEEGKEESPLIGRGSIEKLVMANGDGGKKYIQARHLCY